MKEVKEKELTPAQIQERGVLQSAVVDEVISLLSLQSDAALARAMETHAPVISRLRKGTLPYSPMYLIATHELMHNHGHFVGWQIADLKRKLGLRRVGDVKAAG